MNNAQPNRPALTVEERIDEILYGVGAYYDSYLGNKDKGISVPDAHAAIMKLTERLVLEGRRDECLNERNAMEPNEANGVPYVPHFDAYTSGRLRYLDDEIAVLNRQIEGLEKQ